MNPNELIKAFIGFCFALILMWMALDILTQLIEIQPIYLFLLMGFVVLFILWIYKQYWKAKQKLKEVLKDDEHKN